MKKKIKNWFRYLYNRYRDGVISKMALKASQLILYIHNNASNHDFDTNGEKRIIESLKKCSVGIDVGANIGDWSKLLIGIHPNCKIYAFEIVQDTYSLLLDNIKETKNIECLNFGLSDKEEKIKINYYPNNNTGSSVYALPWGVEKKTIDCQTLKGETFLQERNIEMVDFIKIDAEGHDYFIIKGFDSFLKKGKVRMIQFEYNKAAVLSKILLKDFYEYLEPLGFLIGRVLQFEVEFKDYNLFTDETLMQGNFIAVLKSEKDLINSLNPPK